VELAPDFRAVVAGQAVELYWRTLSEQNNAGFEVQVRGSSGFETIGFVEGWGVSVTPREYRFEIDNFPAGRHVFRLKQVDFDGRFEYSPETAALIAVSGGFQLGNVYPNPFNPTARFTLTLAVEQHVRIGVYDVLGREMGHLYDGVLEPNEPRSFAIQSDAWAGGKYILRVEGENFTASQFFTVVK
jgi:hypothetical protein